jgi:hypothetical protein
VVVGGRRLAVLGPAVAVAVALTGGAAATQAAVIPARAALITIPATAVPGPAVPGPAVPGPAVPGPAVPGPAPATAGAGALARATARTAALAAALDRLQTRAEVLTERYNQETVLEQQAAAAYQATAARLGAARAAERRDSTLLADQAAADYEANGGPSAS